MPRRPGALATPEAGSPRPAPWISVIGLLLLATLLAAAFVQARQFALLNMTLKDQDDYLVLSLYQTETEYLRLREQLRREVANPGSAALQLRYDIFASRVALLDSERTRRLLQDSAQGQEVMPRIDQFLQRADRYLGAEPQGLLSTEAAQALLGELDGLDGAIHAIMLVASHHVALQTSERQAQARHHNRIGLALTAFLLAMAMLFAMVALRQMRTLAQRRQRLETLADQLRDARIHAESAGQARSEFLADMGHALRTPLHSLLGMLSLLKDSPRDPRAESWLGAADDSARHLHHQLEELLDLGGLESGSRPLQPVALRLPALLSEVQALLQPAAAAKGLDLQLAIDPALSTPLWADATRLRQVLVKLLSSAVTFCDTGTVVLRCRAEAAPGEGPPQITFSAVHTGGGIDREALARLFHRFSRGDEARIRRQAGSGLGLAIARKLVLRMGGEIDVHGGPGADSLFSFRCPLQPADAAAQAAAPPACGAGALAVLVAEDHPVNRLLLAALLARLGHQAVLVDDGLAALQAVQAGHEPPFDLVLMDLHMPVMDGLAATAAIRALPAPAGRVCVVVLTADLSADTAQRCRAAGVAEVATKPLSADALQALLARHCGHGGTPPPLPAPAGAQAGNAPALLDRATLHSVRDLMGPAQLPALYGGFFAHAEDAARRMRDAMRQADTEALRRSAHTVKGAALNLGLPALAEAAALLNREAPTLAATRLALAVQRYEEITLATRTLCAGEGLLP